MCLHKRLVYCYYLMIYYYISECESLQLQKYPDFDTEKRLQINLTNITNQFPIEQGCTALMFPLMNIDFTQIFKNREESLIVSQFFENTSSEPLLSQNDADYIKGEIKNTIKRICPIQFYNANI